MPPSGKSAGSKGTVKPVPVPVIAKADYGLDAPRTVKNMFTRGVTFLALGLALYFVNREESPGPAAAMLSSLGTIGVVFLGIGCVMVWSSRVGKRKVRDFLLDQIPWRGDEKVLDVGCGRGLFLIGAAQKLTAGRATGIDIWSMEDLSGNTESATLANAKAEGVGERVRVEEADACKLPFNDASFDVVLSSLAIHNIRDREQRQVALAQMVRVLKPGGRIVIFDIFHTADYAKYLEANGVKDVKLSGLGFYWCVPSRWLIGVKG